AQPKEDFCGMNTCELCGSHRIRWNPPIFEAKDKIPHPTAELFRQRLDTACNRCQECLRACVETPCKTNFDSLTTSIAMAHGALHDLTQFEEQFRRENSQVA